jgi:hypothetical protein
MSYNVPGKGKQLAHEQADGPQGGVLLAKAATMGLQQDRQNSRVRRLA